MKIIKATDYIDYDLRLGDHIIHFYDDDDQRAGLLTDFIKEGFLQNQKCLCVFNRDIADAEQDRLVKDNLDLGYYLLEGQLVFITHEAFFSTAGHFDDQKLLALIVETVEVAAKQGWAGVRIANELTWAVTNGQDTDAWLQFEAKINNYIGNLPVIMLCQYNQRRISGQVVTGLFKTHPYVILGEEMRQNPYFVEPEKFLQGCQSEKRLYM
ncbi:MAG TPA: MEDS domain-containing protein [Candidatus Aquicultor sp.]|jgi:hypothetical protein